MIIYIGYKKDDVNNEEDAFRLVVDMLNSYKKDYINAKLEKCISENIFRHYQWEKSNYGCAGKSYRHCVLDNFSNDEIMIEINKEYALFREWFKYPQKYNEDGDVKALVDKYNLTIDCDLKEHAKHLWYKLNHFENGFNSYFKYRIKESINFFL